MDGRPGLPTHAAMCASDLSTGSDPVIPVGTELEQKAP